MPERSIGEERGVSAGAAALKFEPSVPTPFSTGGWSNRKRAIGLTNGGLRYLFLVAMFLFPLFNGPCVSRAQGSAEKALEQNGLSSHGGARDFFTSPAQEKKFTSQSPEALLESGLKALGQDRYEEAIPFFRQALELDPKLLMARYDLGVAYFAVGKYAEAREAFEEVLRLNPEHLFAAYFLGRVDLAEGDLDQAIRRLEAVSKGKPVADELYYLGSAYFRKGEADKAIRTLKQAAIAKPGDYRIHLLLARCYQKSGKASEGRKEYELSEKLHGTYQTKAREIIQCQQSLASKPKEEAETECRRLLGGDDPTKLISQGVLLAQYGLYDHAVIPLAKAAGIDPEDYEAQFNLGLTYFKMKRYQEAKKPLEAAVTLRPESYDAVALLGSVFFSLADDFGALRQLRHAHQLRPDDEKMTALLFEELRIIAQHYFAQKHYQESVPYFEEALSLRPDVAELHSQLALAYTALGEETKAAREQSAAKHQF